MSEANNGICARCQKHCCNCRVCVAAKGGHPNLCNRCYDAEKDAAVKEAVGRADPG